MRRSVGSVDLPVMFQSTPSVSRGRCAFSCAYSVKGGCFNPRPPFPEGDAWQCRFFFQVRYSFNPRPPFPEGDASSRVGFCVISQVSIHALRFQRAMRKFVFLCCILLKFQSTPSVSRGRCLGRWHSSRYVPLFQSTPSVSRGRCSRLPCSTPASIGFNPRPPFPEGDASCKSLAALLNDVSIHALRFQRAMRVC